MGWKLSSIALLTLASTAHADSPATPVAAQPGTAPTPAAAQADPPTPAAAQAGSAPTPAAAQAGSPATTATLEVTCTQRDVSVRVDGELWMTCPGAQSRPVAAGQHTVEGALPGHAGETRQVTVAQQGSARVDLQLAGVEQPIVLRHRFATWLPWTVMGGGALLGGLGVLAQWSAGNRMDEYDQRVASECAVMGCMREDFDRLGLTDLHESAQFRNKLGLAMLAGGLLAVGTGIVLQFMNRPVAAIVTPTEHGGMAQAAWQF